MKALPFKVVSGVQQECPPDEATYVLLHVPGPIPTRVIPVIRRGTRDGTGCWSWNGDPEKPTLRPSLKSSGTRPLTEEEIARVIRGEEVKPEDHICHTWITDGNAIFLEDSTHEFSGQTLPLLEPERHLLH